VARVGEDGLLGSRYFTDHPTVPRDSIVAQLNTDMLVADGDDHAGGGPEYLRMIGSRRCPPSWATSPSA